MIRAVAAALFVLALLLYAGVASPLRREAAAAADEYRRVRDERRELRARLARLDRRDSVRQALAAGGRPDEAVRAVRRVLVDRVAAAGLTSVRLAVRAGRGPIAASAHLSAQGGFADVLRLCGLLASPESGLVLGQVRLAPTGSSTTLDVDVVAPGVAAPAAAVRGASGP